MEAGGKLEAGRGKLEAGRGTFATARSAIKTYEDLDAYKRAMELLAPTHRPALRFPDIERFELAGQIRRSSKSIPANIAEGYGKKRSTREFKSYLNNALGSANETVVDLKIADALAYGPSDEIVALIDGYTIFSKQLHRLIERWQDFGFRGSDPADSGR